MDSINSKDCAYYCDNSNYIINHKMSYKNISVEYIEYGKRYYKNRNIYRDGKKIIELKNSSPIDVENFIKNDFVKILPSLLRKEKDNKNIIEKYEVEVESIKENDSDIYWVSKFKDRPFCIGSGDTAGDSLNEAIENYKIQSEYIDSINEENKNE